MKSKLTVVFSLVLFLCAISYSSSFVALAQDTAGCAVDTPWYCSEEAYYELWQAIYTSAAAAAPAPAPAPAPVSTAAAENQVLQVGMYGYAANGHEQTNEANTIASQLSQAGLLSDVQGSSSYRNSSYTIEAAPNVNFVVNGQNLGSTITIVHKKDWLGIATNDCGSPGDGYLDGRVINDSGCSYAFTSGRSDSTLSAVVINCPANTTGTYPNCVPIVCLSGYTGVYPDCTQPQKSPPLSCSYNGSVSWGSGCSGSYSGTVQSGGSVTVNNTASGRTGSEDFTCNDGTWTTSSASCSVNIICQVPLINRICPTPPPPATCPSGQTGTPPNCSTNDNSSNNGDNGTNSNNNNNNNTTTNTNNNSNNNPGGNPGNTGPGSVTGGNNGKTQPKTPTPSGCGPGTLNDTCCVSDAGDVYTESNSCGMSNSGYIQCDGSQPSIEPSDSSCATPVITLTENPPLTNIGSPCTINWNIQNATACTLSGGAAADTTLPKSVSIPAGSYTSPALASQVIYKVSCKNGSVVAAQKSIACPLNPKIQEK